VSKSVILYVIYPMVRDFCHPTVGSAGTYPHLLLPADPNQVPGQGLPDTHTQRAREVGPPVVSVHCHKSLPGATFLFTVKEL